MIFTIELSLCIMAWTLTMSRFRTIHWKEIRKDNGIAFHVWLMMVFFSITTIFLIKKFSDLFDAYTFNNLDRLIAYSAVLTGMTFGVTASINAIGTPPDKRMNRWLWGALFATIIALVAIYSVFLSRLSDISYFVPRSIPEVWFMFITFSLGAALCLTMGKVYLAYLPLETSPIMRTRAVLIIGSVFIATAYFLVKIMIAGGYFWTPLTSPFLINVSWVFLVSAAVSHISGLLSNKIYVRFVMVSGGIRSWGTFQDLKYLMKQLLLLCPELVPPIVDPSIWKFVLNPEYYLYRAIITIMDGKTILDDLLSEGALSGEPALWEGDMLRDVVRVKRALQSINQSGNFWELVNEYKRASRGLFPGQDQNPALGNSGYSIG